MRARVLSALLLALPALAVALAGCGGGDETASTGATTSGEPDRTVRTQPEPESGTNGSGQEESAKKEKPAAPEQSPPDQGSSAVTPGVPTAKGGDNSIQEFGAESASGERGQAAATAEAYFEARAAGRWAAACSDLAAAPTRKQIKAFAGQTQGSESAGCPAAMRALTEGAPPAALRAAAQIDVLSLRAEGSRAFLIYRDGEGVPSQIPMAREDGEWKVAAVAGSPLIL